MSTNGITQTPDVTPDVTPPLATCQACFAPLLLDLNALEESLLTVELNGGVPRPKAICNLPVIDESILKAQLAINGPIAALPDGPFSGLTTAQLDTLVLCLLAAGVTFVP
jgi:hypothetical protein